MFSRLAAPLAILIAPLIVIYSLRTAAASSLSPTVIAQSNFGIGKAQWPNQRDIVLISRQIFSFFCFFCSSMCRCRFSLPFDCIDAVFKVHVLFRPRFLSIASHHGVHSDPILLILRSRRMGRKCNGILIFRPLHEQYDKYQDKEFTKRHLFEL